MTPSTPPIFPIDLGAFVPLALDPTQRELTKTQYEQLASNIAICRDAIVFITATAAPKGLGGHTGGPYDIVPEVLIADSFMRSSNRVFPAYFDEAGHRVAIQYLMSTLNGHLPATQLTRYREAYSLLPGHPELGLTPGIRFSSGRLGHMWPYVNGVAMAHPDQAVFCFGSDGSQMEGNDAEAARLAVAHKLNVKIIVDDNDVTIAGHPSQYIPGFDVARTLTGHGLDVRVCDGENWRQLYTLMADAVNTVGPVGIINKRPMAVGIDGLEGNHNAHDVIKADLAIKYLEQRGHTAAAKHLQTIQKQPSHISYRGSSEDVDSNRNVFGHTVVEILRDMTSTERRSKVRVIDSDLEGSCGLSHIREAFDDIYVKSGVMERGNFSAAAGFGMDAGRQGIFGTFSAFLEMIISEITMARLNGSNVLAHFSHAGIDDMADNTCHFGLNNLFAANGLSHGDSTRLYFPADGLQMQAVVRTIFQDPGLRFVFSTRSKVPFIQNTDGCNMFGEGYCFVPGRDEIVRDTSAGGWIVSFGESLYRALDAVEKLRDMGIEVGLINKPTLNLVDEAMIRRVGYGPFVLVVESLNRDTGLGSRFGTWLIERGYHPKYTHLGTTQEGCGGLGEQFPHQGLDSDSIVGQIEQLISDM